LNTPFQSSFLHLLVQAGIPKAIRQLVSKLAECGWLFNKTKSYVENKSADKTFGLVGKVGKHGYSLYNDIYT
jgi:hypothetical protein